VTIRFDLPNQSLRQIFQVVVLCLTSSSGSSCMQVIACSACFNKLQHHILIFWNRKENRAKNTKGQHWRIRWL
jgi:hypothetical protein